MKANQINAKKMHVSAASFAPDRPVHKATPSDNTERTARSGAVTETIFLSRPQHAQCRMPPTPSSPHHLVSCSTPAPFEFVSFLFCMDCMCVGLQILNFCSFHNLQVFQTSKQSSVKTQYPQDTTESTAKTRKKVLLQVYIIMPSSTSRTKLYSSPSSSEHTGFKVHPSAGRKNVLPSPSG